MDDGRMKALFEEPYLAGDPDIMETDELYPGETVEMAPYLNLENIVLVTIERRRSVAGGWRIVIEQEPGISYDADTAMRVANALHAAATRVLSLNAEGQTDI